MRQLILVDVSRSTAMMQARGVVSFLLRVTVWSARQRVSAGRCLSLPAAANDIPVQAV